MNAARSLSEKRAPQSTIAGIVAFRDPMTDETLVAAAKKGAAALPAFGHASWGRIDQPLIDSTTCELRRLAWSLHYSQPGTQNESTDQKTHTDPDKTSDPKNSSIPRGSDSVLSAHPRFGWLGAGARTRYRYCAAIDSGRSDPDCKRH